ncbi:Hint domain-containing protein [Roseomonas fluvialis]|uniref:Hedgehog/Intein (Hint) domain-containing protein n=1 Tax=Roseomonas fluvialis TaxID=1750527 RepID=A0ABN6P1S7_9PROT|nr:Hint domain-containing protein [Roseomonas fluvialis]BDG72539.1 hypothetical protein Rmf_24680 [Roseomonas fluvialis]
MPEAPPPLGLPLGTPVLTPTGEVAVEALVPGMLVLAVGGGAAPFQSVVELRRVLLPGPFVRLRAGALADGSPHDDLVLPPGHAVLLDGTLVTVGDLADDRGILVEAGAALAAVQIVLAGHDAVLACGAAVETAPPEPGSSPCAPRCPPDATLRALLAWRAEAMGWSPPTAPTAPSLEVGSFRARLAASPLTPAAVPSLPIKPTR